MSTFERQVVEGACNEPQPYNWRGACRLRPNHPGEHRAPIIGGWVYDWTRDATWQTTTTPHVHDRAKLGRRHYVRPAAVSR